MRAHVSDNACACAPPCICVDEGACGRACACARIAMLIQYATRGRNIVCGLDGFTTFSTLPHRRHDFQEKVTEHKMCVLTFSTIVVWNISYFKKNSARYCHRCENVMWCRILIKLEFSRLSFESLKFQISSKSVTCKSSCSMRTGRQTNGWTWRS
jgi:hypothetical protein